MNDYARHGSRIVVEHDGSRRALFKVQPLPDGGYAALSPYHEAREGWLTRVHVDYAKKTDAMKLSEMEHFTASDRVKLSHHRDGFVQFSGEDPGRIRSGRDPITGEPKGLAILSAPIDHPISTGPTFGFSAWGIDKFRQLEALRRTDLYFSSSQIYYRASRPGSWNGYHVEGWVIWPLMWAGVYGDEFDLRLSMGFRNFEGSGANLEFRVVPLVDTDCFLALNIHRVKFDFPAESGFVISGPSNRREGEAEGDALRAMYPRDPFNVPGAISIGYTPPVQPPSDPAMLGDASQTANPDSSSAD